MAASCEIAFFKVEVNSNEIEKRKTFFLRCREGQTIGDALALQLDTDLSIKGIRASNTYQTIPANTTTTPPDTPSEVLQSFGVKYIYIDTEFKGNRTEAESKTPLPNAFDVLMKVQKKYDRLPVRRTEYNAKDKLYNGILDLFKEKGFGFTPIQVETTGVYVIKTLTKVLWYIDPHIPKFHNRSIHFIDWAKFRGFNDWKFQKKKEPKVISTELENQISSLLTMLGNPYFLSIESQRLLEMCNQLVDGMKKYLDFLSEQKERTAANHESMEQVRGLSDNWSLTTLNVADKVEKRYESVHLAITPLEPYEPLFLYDLQPEDRFERRQWIEKLALPYPVQFYTHRFGNYLGNFNFVWIPEEGNDEGDLSVISYIRDNLPTYSTRAMRKGFISRYSNCGPKPAILRDMYRFLTSDSSAPETSSEKDVDNRVLEFILSADATGLFYDLRKKKWES